MSTRTAATVFGQLYRSLCVDCLANELDILPGEADAIVRELAATPKFVREWWVCARCGEDDIILRHVPMWPFLVGGC
jgi:hypothetical protein